MNPEFERNLWLEMTPQRLFSAPLVLGLMLFLTLSLSDFVLSVEIAYLALIWFVFFAGIWGTKQATGAVFEEVAGRTWDWQRMSGLNPWAMTWGKLFGSTAFAWYGGLICLGMAAVALQVGGADRSDWQWFVLALLGALFAQGFGFLLSLLYVRSRSLENSRVRGSLYLLVLLAVLMSMGNLAEMDDQRISWYGWQLEMLDFALLSTLCFWLWSLIGAYRVMRRELSYSARPWIWLGFLGFFAAYVGGLTSSSPTHWLASAFVCWLLATYVAVFVEPKDPVQLRGLLHGLRDGQLSRALTRVPAWLSGLVLAALGLQFVPGIGLFFIAEFAYPLGTTALLLLLFLLRDLAIFLILGLSAESRRSESTAMIYLLVLYGIVPSLLSALGLGQLNVLFLPRPDQPFGLALLGAMLGLGLAGVLLIRQWRRLLRL
ncbi:MAG: hypothetical protein HQL47_10425 [Gammaproteobacteria bacterium]|nr:hypothetical protein [Gammaproteobacteria bacterium]